MSAGKTYWWAKDAAWLDREAVVELGVQFGPGGPLVLDALCGMAKLENDAGRVFTGLLSLARKTFTEPDLVHSVVVAAAALGALDDLEFDEDGRRFRCRISGWQADQGRGYESVRKSMQRASAGNPAPDAVPSTGTLSRSVPKCPPTGQDRTEETPFVEPAEAGLARELFGYWQERCGHQKAKATPERLRAIRARLRDGYTPDQIRRAVDGAAVGAYVDDRGKRHDDLTLICRNGSKLEDFIARASAKAPPPPGSDGLRFDREALLAQEASNREARAAREAMYAQEVPA